MKEVAEKQAATMEAHSSQAEVYTVRPKVGPHKVKENTSRSIKGKCFRCGRQGHYAKDKECPARNQSCRNCNKMGHFQSQCRTKSKSNSGPRVHSVNSRRVNTVEVEADSEDDNGYAFVVDEGDTTGGCVDICIGGVVLHNVLIDSGATCNLVDRNTWEALKGQHIRCKSEKTTTKFYAYASQVALKTVGMFTALVQVGKHETQAEFIVIDGEGKPILGRDTAMKLDVLRIGKVEKPEVNAVSENLFKGIGKL